MKPLNLWGLNGTGSEEKPGRIREESREWEKELEGKHRRGD